MLGPVREKPGKTRISQQIQHFVDSAKMDYQLSGWLSLQSTRAGTTSAPDIPKKDLLAGHPRISGWDDRHRGL